VTRLAFLSPLPPAGTGIADYSADVLGLLAPEYELELFHDQQAVDASRLPRGIAAFPVSEFRGRHAERPYDLAIYQMGNGAAHAFLYDPLARVPGMLVLHDLVLHHSRARAFLDSPAARAYAADPADVRRRDAAREDVEAYRAEATYTYPAHGDRLVEAHLATVGDLLPYAYPLFRIPVEASRLTVAHNAFMAAAIKEEVPGAPVMQVTMPVTATRVALAAVADLRRRLRIGADELVVGCFGLLTREKRIETVARAVARAAAALPRIRFLLVGPIPRTADLLKMVQRLGLADRTVITGRVPFGDLATHMEAADLAVHLRYPTARETSAALLRVMAQGRPTIVSDLEHLAEIPAHTVRRVDVADEEGEVLRAVLRLAESRREREALGRAAADFVAREHAPAQCRAAYEDAIEYARGLPAPARRPWPPHWPLRQS
jgi:glycosyltransferase involved in cell wall biosynthesis